LPVGFEYGDDIPEVIDRTTSPKSIWTLQWQVQGKSLARDYGVVAILHDKVTGEPVIILASILAEGIEAASEVGFPTKHTWMQCCKKLRRTGTNGTSSRD
jgi:hypothetical protein